MKKILFAAAALLVCICASAQSAADLAASLERLANLRDCNSSYPKTIGVAEIDSYTSTVYRLSNAVIETGDDLHALTAKVQGGEKVDAKTVLSLSASIADEGLEAADLVKAGESAVAKEKALVEAAKNVKNPLQKAKAAADAAKATNAVAYTLKAAPIVVEESVAQGKMVKELSDAIKAKK